MRAKPNNQYTKSYNQERSLKNVNNKSGQVGAYQTIKARLGLRKDQQQNRKHNSPDMNRYRGAQTKPASNSNRRPTDREYQQIKNYKKQESKYQRNQDGRLQKRQREDHSPEYSKHPNRNEKPKQLSKNSSSPNLKDQKQVQEEQNQDYLKLHQKLDFIQSKIADMKRHVQKKREQKQQLQEARKQRQEQRELQRRTAQQNTKINLKQFVTQVPQQKQLHSFQNNPYSPRHSIYYISEIIKSYKDDKSLGRQHLLTSLHILKILQNSQFADNNQMRERQVHLPYRQGYQGKKSVIFDLDQTLIHCNDTLTPPYDVKLPITFPTGEVIEAGINIRPYARQILQNLSKYFQIIVFTASHSCYANVVLDYLDPQRQYIHHRLFRQHCYQTPEGMYCKDLRIIDRAMDSMILVDNAAYSYAAQLDNGIPILPYYHGKTDFELKALQKYLQGMLLVKDVRTLNRKTFQLHKYRNYYSQPERLVEQLYMQEESSS